MQSTKLNLLFIFFHILQHVGASITKYPNIERWYNQCRTDVKGFQENEQGAKFFAERVTTKLEEQF